jgi:hypothetical protein
MSRPVPDGLSGKRFGVIAGGEIGGGLNPIKTAKEMLRSDLETLQESPEELGMTESQKSAIADKAQAREDARAGADMAALQRTQLAGQGFQAGGLQEAVRERGAASAGASAQATAGAEEASREMITRESARIRGQLDAARARNKKMYESAASALIPFAEAGGEAIGDKLGNAT